MYFNIITFMKILKNYKRKINNQIKNNVICMKWGDKFSPDYVNRLYKSVKKYLSIPYRFVCLTDDNSGLLKEIETFPLPDISFSDEGPERGWKKISVFQKDLFDLKGNALFLDVDVVITGNIDEFFNLPGCFYIIKDWDFKNIIGNSSVFRFEIGKHSDVLDNFEKNFDKIKKQFRNEQAYLSYFIHGKGLLKYWPKEWCVSFKRHCMKYFPLNYFIEPKLPEKTKILIFHGHPNPLEALSGYRSKFGLRNVIPPSWLRKFFH